MSLLRNDQVLHAEITDSTVAALVANALRREHAESDAVIKRIERMTGANPNSIRKWFNGCNAPKLGHFLILAKFYPLMLRMMLELIGRSDAWEACVQHGVPERMRSGQYKKHADQGIYTDRFVSINAVVDSQIAGLINHRQLWFLGKLQQGHKVKADDIASVWCVTSRTAWRDISGLVDARLIEFIGARKNGYYKNR